MQPLIIRTALAVAAIGLATRTGSSQISVPDDFATIQKAVDAAAPGMTITVAAGTYVEQVLIEGKDLSIVGEPGTLLLAPEELAGVDQPGFLPRTPIVGVTGCRVNLTGLAFDGERRGEEFPRMAGALYVGAGGTVSACSFTGFRPENLAAPTDERGLQAYNPPVSGPIRRFDVLDCAFDDTNISIALVGDQLGDPNLVRFKSRIVGNVVVGFGPTADRSQIGVFLPYGVVGSVRDNLVTDHAFLGAGAFSIGILIGNSYAPGVAEFTVPGLLCEGNECLDNLVGITVLHDDGSLLRGNTVVGGTFGFSGIAVSGAGDTIIQNDIDMTGSVIAGNSGVALLGDEFDGPFATGVASDAAVGDNTITGAEIPIWEQTSVTGTVIRLNTIIP